MVATVSSLLKAGGGDLDKAAGAVESLGTV